MDKTTEGLYQFINTFESVLQTCSSDKTFFLELTRYMRTIYQHNKLKDLWVIFGENSDELDATLGYAEKMLEEAMDTYLEQITRHKDFPKKNPVIAEILRELDDRKKGMYLTTEPMAETKYYYLLKCVETLDTNEYAHIINNFKNSDNGTAKYSIHFERSKYNVVKHDYKLQSEASVWFSYDKLMQLPLFLYDYAELYDSELQRSTMEKNPNPFSWFVNLQGLHSEFRTILDGRNENPVEFKRDEYFFHFKRLTQYLLSYLKGLIVKSEKYNSSSTNLSVEGLVNINTKNQSIQYVGTKNRNGNTYKPSQRNQIYVLIVELAKADGHKLPFERVKKYLSDPVRCERRPKISNSNDAQIMKALVRRTIEVLDMSPDELKVNEKQKLIYLNPLVD